MSDYNPLCWMCTGGELRIFVDENDDKVKIEHVGQPCRGWLASKRLAEFMAQGAGEARKGPQE